ncbi:MAG: fibronectin type III domain-containing protein [Patescibacteria group bacterium]
MPTKIFATLLGIVSLACSGSFALAEIPSGYVLVPANVFFGESTPSPSSATNTGATVSTTKSAVRVNDEIGYVGERSTNATVSLRDNTGRPVAGVSVNLISSRGTDAVESSRTITNSNGEAVFQIIASAEGVSSLTALAGNQTLLERPRVVFLQKAGGVGGNLLHADLLDGSTDATIAATSDTPIATNQIVVDFASLTSVNTPTDLTVSIKDANGNLVEDFVGTVKISSSDALAILPQEYTFVTLDRGTHVFANAVTFTTVGQQTISVSGDNNVSAQEITTIVESEDGPAELSLAPVIKSPVSGDLLNDTIVVSGSAPTNTNLAVFVDGQFFQDTDSDTTGNFSSNVVLADGGHEITVGVLNSDGSVNSISEAVTITLDQTKPVIENISLQPSNKVTSGETVTVEIKSEPGLMNVQFSISDQLIYLDESATLGVYTGEFAVATAGAYFAKVELEDSAGNIGNYPDATSLLVEAAITIDNVELTPQDGRIDLRWNAPANADEVTNYQIFYGENEAELTKKFTTSDNSTAWYIDGLTNETPYFFRIVSFNATGGENGGSAIVAAAPTAPIIETQPVATQVCNGRIILKWDTGNPEVTNYRLDYGTASGEYIESRLLPGGATRSEWEVRDLINGAEYFFTLSGVDDFGNIVVGFDEASATPNASAVCSSNDPVQLFQRVDADGNAILTWNAVPGATSYLVHAGTQPNIYDLATVEVESTAFRPAGLLANTNYYFAVSAVFSGVHQSATLSNVIKVEVGPAEILLISLVLALGGAFWIRRTRKAGHQS